MRRDGGYTRIRMSSSQGAFRLRPSSRLARRPAARTLLALTLAGVLAACGGPQTPQRGPAEVGYVTLTAQPVALSTELTGRTSATEIAQVVPQVTGIVEDRLFTEGAMVHAGQPLYRIDPRLYAAALASNRAAVESAQATLAANTAKLDRYNALTDKAAISAQDLSDATAAQRSALAALHQAQANVAASAVNLQFTRVLAPITGRIGRSNVTKGALVSANQPTPLATITRLDPIYVDIVQSTTDLLQLRKSLAKGSVLPSRATVTLKLEDGSDYPLKGDIEFSEVTVDQTTSAVTLRARFPNPDGLLLPGMFVRVETPQGTVPNGILAPQQGITRDPRGHATALVIDAGNKAALRQITVGAAIGTNWLVTSGLRAGDRLIVQGTDKAMPGAQVKPVAVKLGY